MKWGSWGSRNTMIERAEEELEILETHYPNKFQSLKEELKILISEFECDDELLIKSPSMSQCPSAATQESSSRKKRKQCCCVDEEVDMVEASAPKRRCNTWAVLDRARKCLRKIQNFKTSLSL